MEEKKYPSTISPKYQIETAGELYPYNKTFQLFSKNLQEQFISWRGVRGDGNCYYRAVGVNLIEQKAIRGYPYIRNLIDHVKHLRYEIQQIFNCNLASLIGGLEEIEEAIRLPSDNPNDTVERCLQDTDFDYQLVLFLRCIIAKYMRDNMTSDDIAPFVTESYAELVNPILTYGTEAEGLMYIAAPRVLGCTIKHVTMASYGELCITDYSAGSYQSSFDIYLWLRPGHYDLLYIRESKAVLDNEEQIDALNSFVECAKCGSSHTTIPDSFNCMQCEKFCGNSCLEKLVQESLENIERNLPFVIKCPGCSIDITDSLKEFECLQNIFRDFVICNTCGDYHQINQIRTLDCNHKFGEKCLIAFLKSRIENPASFDHRGILCPSPSCDMAINGDILEDILSEEDIIALNKYIQTKNADRCITFQNYYCKVKRGSKQKKCRYCKPRHT